MEREIVKGYRLAKVSNIESRDETMVKITCLTENTALRGSPFWAEHGLSFCIETDQGCVLFDTGQTASVLLHNMALLSRSLNEVDAIVLSHAHVEERMLAKQFRQTWLAYKARVRRWIQVNMPYIKDLIFERRISHVKRNIDSRVE